MQLTERARRYVGRMEVAVTGSHGHDKLLKVAIALRHGFGLPLDEAWPIVREYSERCLPPWNDKELAHKLQEAVRLVHAEPRGHLAEAKDWSNLAEGAKALREEMGEEAFRQRAFEIEQEALARQQAQRNWREFDPAALAHTQLATQKVGKEWLWRRSPVDCRCVAAGIFLTHVTTTGDRILVFTNEQSQGQYLFWNHDRENRRGWYRLADRRGVSAQFAAPAHHTPPDLMRAPQGAWWMCQPVTGEWKGNGERWSRRSEGNVTRWGTMVIESDEEGIERAWLNLLVQLPVPVLALYTSGVRSVHALVRVDADSKAAWDRYRDLVKPLLTKLGADRGVFSAIRLTRLPGCFRLGKYDRKKGRYLRFDEPRLQRLLYLNPDAEARPILDLPVLRTVPMWEEAYA